MRFCGVTMIKLNVFYTTLILLFSPQLNSLILVRVMVQRYNAKNDVYAYI